MLQHTEEQKDAIVAELLKNYRTGEWHARRGLEQDFKCIYCDLDYLHNYNAYRSVEFDHIIPQSKGGEHSYDNIAVCCRTCNLLKGSHYPKGRSRQEQLADSRLFVQKQRAAYDAELEQVRKLVR